MQVFHSLELNNKCEEFNNRCVALLVENEKLKNDFKDISDAKATYENEITKLKETIDIGQKTQSVQAIDKIQILHTNYEALKLEMAKLNEIHENNIAKLELQAKQGNELIVSQGDSIKDLQTKISSKEEAYNSLMTKYNENEETLTNTELRNVKLQGDIDVYKSQIKKLQQTNKEFNDSKDQLAASIATKDKLLEELNNQLKAHINESKEISKLLKINEELTQAVYTLAESNFSNTK